VKTRTPRLVAAFLAVAVAASLTACSTRAGADEIYLYYASGAGDDKKFVECIQPGTAGSYPIDDEIFALPTSLRTWNIRPEGGDTNQPIKSGSKPVGNQPGPEVVIYATADFYLNTDCKAGKDSPVVKFWENTGRRYGVAVDGEEGFKQDAWRSMLLNTLVPAEEKALREQTRNWTADELDANLNGAWGQMEKQLGPLFLDQLRAKVGGDYFCGAGYARGAEVEWSEWVADGTDEKGLTKFKEEKRKGTCPPVRISIIDVNFADPGIAAARASVFKAEQEAKAKLIAAQAELEQSRILGEAAKNEAYLKLKQIEADLEAAKACAANPNCTLVVGASGVNVNTGK
jgi:hypothetical protein